MSLRFTLRQLHYLVAVADCGAVALAAERVNASSPAICAAGARLEAAFGLHLFTRRHAQGPVRGRLVGLLPPKGAALRRTLTAFLDHCRVHLADAALPGHHARAGSA